MPRERERRGETRRLDAKEIDEAAHAVLALALHNKVSRGLASRLYFGADARVVGHERALG